MTTAVIHLAKTAQTSGAVS